MPLKKSVAVAVGGQGPRESGIQTPRRSYSIRCVLDRYLSDLGVAEPGERREIMRKVLHDQRSKPSVGDTQVRLGQLLAAADAEALERVSLSRLATSTTSFLPIPRIQGTALMQRQNLQPLVDPARIGFGAASVFRRAKTVANPG